jgi:hypothetical protein
MPYWQTVSTHKMRPTRYIIFLALILGACIATKNTRTFIGGFPEKDYDFMESIEQNSTGDYFYLIRQLKWGGTRWGLDLEKKMFMWLRNPDNLMIAFNTFEFVGLEKFISKEQYYQKIFDDDYWDYDWNGKSLYDICKIMINCYSDSTGFEKYYQDFWERRKLENNDFATIEILKRIDRIYTSKSVEIIKTTKDYDTLMYLLLDYDVKMQKSDSLTRTKIIVDYFDYLKRIDLEHSAYNLIFEVRPFQYLNINRDSLLMTLKYDTIPEEKYWTIRNDAKWIKSYRDNGP